MWPLGKPGACGNPEEAPALLWALDSTWWTGVQLTPEEWRGVQQTTCLDGRDSMCRGRDLGAPQSDRTQVPRAVQSSKHWPSPKVVSGFLLVGLGDTPVI